jgi:hypothetical protein
MKQYKFDKNKIVIYTSITGDYDTLIPVRYNNCKHICFTDRPNRVPKGWEIVDIKDFGLNIRDNRRHSRWFKFHATTLFPENKSIWKDGNIILRKTPQELLKFSEKSGISARTHPLYDCLYKEAERVINEKIANPETVKRQMERYKKEGFPKQFGLTENCVLPRIPNEDIKEFEKLVWKEYINGSVRDQLCVMYASWKLNINIKEFPRNYFRRKQPHLKPRMYQ